MNYEAQRAVFRKNGENDVVELSLKEPSDATLSHTHITYDNISVFEISGFLKT
jgi:hypothetical protein